MKIQFTMILVVAAACCSTLRADMAKKDLAPAPIPVTVVAGNATNRYNLAVVSDDGDVRIFAASGGRDARFFNWRHFLLAGRTKTSYTMRRQAEFVPTFGAPQVNKKKDTKKWLLQRRPP